MNSIGEFIKSKENGVMTPIIYNPESFEVVKVVLLKFKPELIPGVQENDEDIRRILHEELDKLLDNPTKYI